jgi:hypothetical protein
MTKGIIIFAHNGPEVDYGTMSVIAGGLAKKHLGLPVSLITDKWTISWLKESGIYTKAESIFDKIIEIEKPWTKNKRKLHDGFHSQEIPFVNSNRCSAYDLSPYDQTMLIDSDFLIFSDQLNEYWNVDSSVMLGHSMNDFTGNRSGVLDQRVSETGIHMFWATTVMFTKNQESRFFFKLVDFIKDNYAYYADLFRFDSRQYRNDIAFSVAKHIMNGFETELIYTLPPVLTVFDKDILHAVDNSKLTFLIDKPLECGNFWAATSIGVDVHIMNKQSIIRHKDQLLELI